MRSIVYISLFVARWFAATVAFRSLLLFRLLDGVNTFAYDLSAYLANILSPRQASQTTRLSILRTSCQPSATRKCMITRS